MKKPSFLIVFLLTGLLAFNGNSQNTTLDFSKIEAYKNAKKAALPIQDFDSVFTEKERKTLSKMFYKYHKKSTNVIVLVTVDSIAPFQDPLKFATSLANYWGVGYKGKDNGLVLLLCKPSRKVAIATGNGTQKILTDSMCKETIDKIMIPEFKKNNFYGGIKKGVLALIKVWGDGD